MRCKNCGHLVWVVSAVVKTQFTSTNNQITEDPNVKSNKVWEEYYVKEWEEKKGIKVVFWNEDVFDAFEANIKKLC